MARTKLALKSQLAQLKAGKGAANVSAEDTKPTASPAKSAAPAGEKPLLGGKKRRRKDRKRWQRECRKWQKETNDSRVMPLATTSRFIRQLATDLYPEKKVRFSPDALRALRAVSISHMTELFKDSFMWAVAHKKHTLTVPAMRITRKIKEDAAERYRPHS